MLEDIDIKEIVIKEYKDKGLVSTFLYVFEVKITKKKHIRTFLINIFRRIEDFQDFLKNINFDENFSIYLRIDKYTLIEKGIIRLVDSGNVFHVKISFDIPRKNRETIKRILEDIYKEAVYKNNY